MSRYKAPVSTNGIKAYNKETLADEIYRFNITNVQLAQDKQQIDRTKIALEADKQ